MRRCSALMLDNAPAAQRATNARLRIIADDAAAKVLRHPETHRAARDRAIAGARARLNAALGSRDAALAIRMLLAQVAAGWTEYSAAPAPAPARIDVLLWQHWYSGPECWMFEPATWWRMFPAQRYELCQMFQS